MIELLISMVILNVGLLALVAAFNSGAFALRRASSVATASTLANAQMELYRAMLYTGIALDSARVTTLTSTDNDYSCDSAIKIDAAQACGSGNRVTQVSTAGCTTPLPNECEPSRLMLGPDNRRYRVDTYIITDTPPTGRAVKRVTVVVRDAQNLSKPALQRVASVFDQSTGL
jgi:type II secretory pathway pseudopilin PulG